MVEIGLVSDFNDNKSYPLTLKGKELLLVCREQTYYLIANHCGHFGSPLTDATINDNEIICAQHGISFSLESGQVINRPFENCDPIEIMELEIKEGTLYWDNKL